MLWEDMLICWYHIFSYPCTVQIMTCVTDLILSEHNKNSTANIDYIVTYSSYLVLLSPIL